MNITRKWAMPSADTFDVPPIGEFVKSYLRNSKVSIDPFARNKRWATYTNDLNKTTAAEYHMYADEFLRMLLDRGVTADLVIFDPPYSLRQAQEVYEEFGAWTFEDTQKVGRWTIEKDLIYKLLTPGGVVLSFGWNSQGMGRKNGVELNEILIVCHGGAHNDTICVAERKEAHQVAMFAQVSA